MKTTALTVGAVAVLSQGKALGDGTGGAGSSQSTKTVVLQRKYNIVKSQASAGGEYSGPVTLNLPEVTKFSLAVENAIKKMATNGSLVEVPPPTTGKVPTSAKLHHIATSGGPENGKPYVLLNHFDSVSEAPDDGTNIEECSVSIRLHSESTQVIVDYTWQ